MKSNSGHGLTRNFAVLVATSAIMRFFMQLTKPYEQLYIIALGGSATIVGFASSLSSLVKMVVTIPGGLMADKVGRKLLVGLTTFGTATSFLMLAFAPNWQWFTLGLIVAAFFSIRGPAFQALKADSTYSRTRGLAYALSEAAASTPTIFAPFIGGLLLVSPSGAQLNIGAAKLLYFSGFLGFLFAAILRTFLLTETLENSSSTPALHSLKNGIIYSWYALKWYTAFNILVATAYPFVYLFRVVYLVESVHMSTADVGFFLAVSKGTAIIASFAVGVLIDKWGRRLGMGLGVILAMLGITLLILGKDPLVLATAIVFLDLGVAIRSVSLQVYRADAVPLESRGLVFSILATLNLAIQTIASPIAGFLYETYGKKVFTVSLLAYVLTIIVLTKVPEPKRLERNLEDLLTPIIAGKCK